MGLFSRKPIEPPPKQPDPWRPSVGLAELSDATRLMDRWDVAMSRGNDAMWECLTLIGQRGGADTSDKAMAALMNGPYDYGQVIQRPWRWWTEAARNAHESGDQLLPSRIFLFMLFFNDSCASKMNVRGFFDTGLEAAKDPSLTQLTNIAAQSFAALDPDLVVHDSHAGRIDAKTGLIMARTYLSTRNLPR